MLEEETVVDMADAPANAMTGNSSCFNESYPKGIDELYHKLRRMLLKIQEKRPV